MPRLGLLLLLSLALGCSSSPSSPDASGRERGSAADATPPAPDATPPALDALDARPLDARPPALDAKPPALDAKPPAPDAKPPALDGKPPAPDGKPPAPDGKPPAPDAKPPAPDLKPPAPDAAPPGPLTLVDAFPSLSFIQPVDLQHAGDGSDRLFVVEKPGQIWVFANSPSVPSSSLFLDLTSKGLASGSEEGLLGLAFHPQYKTNGLFYVNYVRETPHQTVIARYKVSAADPNVADLASEQIVLTVDQPYDNHNGGQLAFGPDGFLYIGLGDGGSSGDPQGNGQNLKTLLGKMLRIDVSQSAAGKTYAIPADNPLVGNTAGQREEIWAAGLRNPWRYSFDSLTGALWVGDVGQNQREEVNLVEKGKNYGWNVLEGTLCYKPSTGCMTAGMAAPVWEYDHTLGYSITGGFVYRGKKHPQLAGAYVYGDFGSGRIWKLSLGAGGAPVNQLVLHSPGLQLASFGVDQQQELYLVSLGGQIFRFQ